MLRNDTTASGVLVCGEVRGNKIHSVTLELIGKARELADKKNTEVSCLLCYGALDDDVNKLFKYGADKVIVVQNPSLEFFNQEIFAKAVSHVITSFVPEIVLAPATTAGRTYLPAVAAMVHTGLTADCTELDIDEASGLLLQTRPAIGGNVMATIKTPDHVPQMATVRPKTFRVPAAAERCGEVIYYDAPADVFSSRIENLSMESSGADDVNIQDRDVVVAGGKGLRRPENFKILEELAQLLDGGIGASRPTVEAKWMPYRHQVGLSGKVVSPKLYFAIGISGAVQHLAGMQTSQKIVAVNKDPDAPIFKVSDVALCGDLMDIVPMLIDRIKREERI